VSAPGKLYLLPAWLSEGAPPADVVPAAVLQRMHAIQSFVVEDAKSARRYLAACGHPTPMRELQMAELNEHTLRADVAALLTPATQGHDIGILSEAGVPAVADPGALLVAEAHAHGVVVVPMVGPSSILLALMANGLEGQRFRFVGYLPADSNARRAAITELEKQSQKLAETQLFIETPYRNEAMLDDVLAACRPSTRLAVAADITGPSEWIRMMTIAEWKKEATVIGKRPAIFLLMA